MKRFLILFSVCVFVLSLTAVSAFAYDYNGNEYPSSVYLEDGTKVLLADLVSESEDTNALLVNSDGVYCFYVITGPISVSATGTVGTGSSAQVTTYVYSSSGTAGFYYEKSWTTNFINYIFAGADQKVVWCARELLRSNGDVFMEGDEGFFPETPLEEQIHQVTEKGLEAQMPKVAGTMKTLVLCGVGLLALLVLLNLFGKVLNRYRA